MKTVASKWKLYQVGSREDWTLVPDRTDTESAERTWDESLSVG